MLWSAQNIALALTAGLLAQTHAASGLNVVHDLSGVLQPRNLVAREDEQSQRYLPADEKMPFECAGACEKFKTLTADCKSKNGTDWETCVCTTESFDAWNSCGSCAPEYYDVYEGGFANFFKNALSECEAVGCTVALSSAAPSANGADGKDAAWFKPASSGDTAFSAAKSGGTAKTNGTTSATRVGGGSSANGAPSTYLVNTFCILAISGSLTSLFIL